MSTRFQRRAKFQRLDAWLIKFNREHPFLFWLLALGIAGVVFGLLLLVDCFLPGPR